MREPQVRLSAPMPEPSKSKAPRPPNHAENREQARSFGFVRLDGRVQHAVDQTSRKWQAAGNLAVVKAESHGLGGHWHGVDSQLSGQLLGHLADRFVDAPLRKGLRLLQQLALQDFGGRRGRRRLGRHPRASSSVKLPADTSIGFSVSCQWWSGALGVPGGANRAWPRQTLKGSKRTAGPSRVVVSNDLPASRGSTNLRVIFSALWSL